MRRNVHSILLILSLCGLFDDGPKLAFAQSPRTAPLPIRTVGRGLFRQHRQNQQQEQDTPAEPRSPIPTTPPGRQMAQATPQLGSEQEQDAVLAQVKRAISINRLRYLDPSIGHSPWMIMHGLLALRQEYDLKIGNQTVNALDYVTKQNPTYSANLPDPTKPGSPVVRVHHHWFEATAYGARAQPYIVSFAFEGHTNQFLAILSTVNLPLTHEFQVSDPQRPGKTKTVTMADMVRHAQLNVHVGNPNEVAWTLWFLSNYLEPDAKWTDKNGQPWSMEQLVITQTNAPLFQGTRELAPCGGTHGLFALACACNSYQAKFGKLQGAWLAARQKLDNHIELAKRMQNRDGSFSSEFFKATGYSAEMSKRFKSSGHMLEWLIMALPPERLEERWVRSAVMSVSNDLVRWGSTALGTADTGAMYHGLHALVLYRNRVEPPVSLHPPEQLAELPPEMRNQKPSEKSTEVKSAVPAPLPSDTKKEKGMETPAPMPNPPEGESDGKIQLINPSTNKLSPLGSVKPLLRPITSSKTTPTPEPDSLPSEQAPTIPEPPPLAERIDDTEVPVLEKPTTSSQLLPAPSEPTAEDESSSTDDDGSPSPLFGGTKTSQKETRKPLPVPNRSRTQPAKAPEPTPPRSASSLD